MQDRSMQGINRSVVYIILWRISHEKDAYKSNDDRV